jgi:hypothetical protein
LLRNASWFKGYAARVCRQRLKLCERHPTTVPIYGYLARIPVWNKDVVLAPDVTNGIIQYLFRIPSFQTCGTAKWARHAPMTLTNKQKGSKIYLRMCESKSQK